MNSMFREASDFNFPLNAWATKLSNVVNMNDMFRDANSFNQVIRDWTPYAAVACINFVTANTSLDCVFIPAGPLLTCATGKCYSGP